MPELKHFALFVLVAVALGIILAAFATADFSHFGKGLMQRVSPADCVGVARVEGEIGSAPQGSFFSASSMPEDLDAALTKADEDPSIGSILLLVDSPGGTAVPSEEMYDSVARAKKPVVAYLGEVAASGGYYVASASDYIVANPQTITGSIGERATILNYAELFTKLGVHVDSYKSGSLKDMGEGYRNATPEEQQIINGLLLEGFEVFRQDVVKARGARLNKPLFDKAMDARILTAKQALATGLVDEIGSRHAALLKAAQLGNVTVGEGKSPSVCELQEKSGIGAFLSQLSSSFAYGLVQGIGQPRLSLRYELPSN